VDYLTILFVAGLAAGAVSVFTGLRGLQTKRVYVSAFSSKALTGPAARRVSWACIVVGVAVLIGVYVLMEKM